MAIARGKTFYYKEQELYAILMTGSIRYNAARCFVCEVEQEGKKYNIYEVRGYYYYEED